MHHFLREIHPPWTSSWRHLSTRCATVSSPLTPQPHTLAATPTAAEPLPAAFWRERRNLGLFLQNPNLEPSLKPSAWMMGSTLKYSETNSGEISGNHGNHTVQARHFAFALESSSSFATLELGIAFTMGVVFWKVYNSTLNHQVLYISIVGAAFANLNLFVLVCEVPFSCALLVIRNLI
jgi:hypothetical protein